MSNFSSLAKSVLALCAVLMLSISTGCGDKDPNKKPGTKTETSKKSGDKEGDKNEESDTSCADLAEDPDACRANSRCTYDENKEPACADAGASILGQCAAIQEEGACNEPQNSELSCRWNSKTSLCVDKKGDTPIHVWNKIMLPYDAEPQFHKVVVSSDNKIYALNAASGTAGLYYSADGQDFEKLDNLKGKPDPAAAESNELTINDSAEISANKIGLYATEEGAVIHKGDKIVVLKGSDVVWALDTSKHHKNQPLAVHRVEVDNKAISFAGVLNTASGQALVFQQAPAYTVHFHKLSDMSKDIKTLKLKNGAAELDINLSTFANNTEGEFLLAGKVAPGWGRPHYWSVLEFKNLGANLDNAAFGKGEEVFSSGVGLWGAGALVNTWSTASTNDLRLVGKRDGLYYANLNDGLIVGQGPPANTKNITFKGTRVDAVISFDNKILVAAPDQGLLIATDALMQDPGKSLQLSAYRDSLSEMMADSDDQIPDLASKDLLTILSVGTDNYFVLKNALYRRVQSNGQKRL